MNARQTPTMKKILLLCLLLASCTCFANRIFVNPLATDTSDGTSWAQTQITLNTDALKAGVYIAILRKKNGEMVYVKFVKL